MRESDMNAAEWERKRSEFNHDWLRNIYIRRLRAFLSRLAHDQDSPVIREFLREDFPMWKEKVFDALWLAENLIGCLTPRRFFDIGPLLLSSSSTIDWLPDITYLAWIKKHRVEKRVDILTKSIRRVDLLFLELEKELNREQKVDSLLFLSRKFDKFEKYCRRLSNTLSNVRKDIGII